ncbi:MAG: serine/threonine-protein kinase, partial [Myxococcota bacterium]
MVQTTMLDASVDSAESDGADIEAGTEIGRFVVLSRLGAGGMGQVFEAYDRELDRRVAVKVLHERRGASADAQTRLLREAQALARLSHPHVVSVYDVGRHDGQVYIAMEFIQGQTLGGWLADQDRPWTEVLRVFVDMASGLQAIHELGFVHRDVKPENVLIDAEGRLRIIDFGLARAVAESESSSEGATEPGLFDTPLTQTGAIVGTPRYMSPEQYQRRPVTPASDQFSFCVALYEALYGTAPFLGKTFTARAAAVLAEELQEPPERGLPGEILDVLKRGLRLDPLTRWTSMEELADLLHKLVASHDPELDDPEERRRRRIVLGLVVIMILAVPGLFTGLFLIGVLPFTAATHAGVEGLTVLSFGLVLWVTRALWSESRLGRRLSWYAMMLAP